MADDPTHCAPGAPPDAPDDSIDARARRVIGEFSALGDAIERYRYLVALGDGMPGLDEAERTEESRLPGCQYGLWIRTVYDDARRVLRFRADSDSKITRGLAALLVRVLDGQPPGAIEEAELDFLDTIELRGHLSANRSSGLSAMVHEMKRRARQCLAAGEGAPVGREGGPGDLNPETGAGGA